MIPSLFEWAMRALVVAAAVWAGLGILRVRDVLAQKLAWGLVLGAAVLMPVLLPLSSRLQIVPSAMTLALPARPWQVALDSVARPPAVAQINAPQQPLQGSTKPREFALSSASAITPGRVVSRAANLGSATPRSTIEIAPPVERSHIPRATLPLLPALRMLALATYLAVCAVLLLRMAFGLTTAIGLWLDAEPVPVDEALAATVGIGGGLRLRSSRAVASPVTIGSGVVLPANYDEWDDEKLRIVLAHERSHIEQRDFYLQLLAGVYAALFWFSPLGWWLKRKLSDLGEAISDRAGLKEAASRSSYTQILLEFAAAPRPTLIGVAMARPSSLSQRIERLLNDSSFRQAFSSSRARGLLAVLLVPTALIAATALIRVEAAGVSAQVAAPPPPSAPMMPMTAAIAGSPAAPPAPSAPITAAIAPLAAPMPPPPPDADENISVGRGETFAIAQDNSNTSSNRGRSYSHSGAKGGFAYSFRSDDDDSYALVTEPAGGVRFSGDWIDGRRQQIDKASHMAHGGKFLWFEHDGKSYLIDDPAIIAGIEAMYKPMDELGRKQEELGKQQEELGRQQEELGKKQEGASVPTPDISKEIAELNAALAKLQAKKGSMVTQDELGDLQGKIGDLQGKLGDIEGKIGEQQGKLGEEQGKLGDLQGKLGDEQGKLGEEQGRIAEEADHKVRAIIADSLTNGKARPVE